MQRIILTSILAFSLLQTCALVVSKSDSAVFQKPFSHPPFALAITLYYSTVAAPSLEADLVSETLWAVTSIAQYPSRLCSRMSRQT